MMAVTIQENVTIANPSLFVSVLEYLVQYHKGRPKVTHVSIEMMNPCISGSP
tara:strand:- start:509 stop:664 length:156 start_codon:yes stop_codon:yes gene_type:complete